MRTKRPAFIITTGAAVVCFAIVAVFAATITLVVYPGNLQGWQPVTVPGSQPAPATTPSVNFVNGPGTPPLGTGSAQLSVGSDGDAAAELRHPGYAGTTLPTPTPTPDPEIGPITYPATESELTALTYSTYVQQPGSGGQAPYIILRMDYDNNGTQDDLLFYEPVYQTSDFCPSNPQPGVATGEWQTWDALNGCWWSLNGTAGATPGSGVKPLRVIGVDQPNAKIVNAPDASGGVRIVAGFGALAWDNFIGNVDNFQIGVGEDPDTGPNITIYDFEAGAPPVEEFTDVGVQKQTSTSTAFAGNNATYTITVTTGGNAASGVTTLSDTLPGTMTFVSFDQTSGPTFSCMKPEVGSGGTITCTASNLPANSTAVFTLVGNIPAETPPCTSYTNVATVANPNDVGEENNSSSATTDVVAFAPPVAGWTTAGNSGATEDKSNPTRPSYTNFTAAANPGSPGGNYILRYNITATGNLTDSGAPATILRVRYRDEGAGSRVVVRIMQANINGGSTQIGTLFDSDNFTPASGYQMQEIAMPTLTFDFSQNIYWLEVTLTKASTSNQPGFGAALIMQQASGPGPSPCEEL
jgi:uncharacterized repeat protein (TIGR01451 family)